MNSTASKFWALARTPKWIGALLLALAVAAGFAALGQWQLERSVENAATVDIDTETAVRLESIAEPGSGVTEAQAGRVVEVTGILVPGDTVELTDRPDGLGGRGTWLVAHVVTDAGVSVAVALGSTEVAAAAPFTSDERIWVGRYLPSEEPQSSDFENGQLNALSVPQLINLWADAGPVYSGFIVLEQPASGLDPIRADAPVRDLTLNLLNVFYAIEWALFAGFAIYLWYRLVRDAVERSEETREVH